MFNEVNPRQSFPEMEVNIVKFWRKNDIFKKSIAQREKSDEYTFYDGPPFATGLPHYGHILPGTIKDVIPRYITMKGYKVDRRFGWDCHGLPVENEVEKMLELKNKKDIEDMGVAKFNETCRSIVLKYVHEWEETVERMGRWVDFKNDYKTMSAEYMESIWWVFKQLWDKGLVYRGHKPMHICPRCETPLSNFEVTQGYKDVTDQSVTAKFRLVDEDNTYVLAWTTTPWTLPGNLALAVNPEYTYVKALVRGYYKKGQEDPIPFDKSYNVIILKELVKDVLGEQDTYDFEIITEFAGEDLIGKKYDPLFPYFKDNKEIENIENAYIVISEKFVSKEEGTGVVHIAPAFGEDDMLAGKRNNLPFIQHVEMNGVFIDDVTDFKGVFCKDADKNIIEYLKNNDLLFTTESYKHAYPHCWRCDSALLNYSTDSWFVNVEKVKDRLLNSNNEINWVPEHIKEGRFGKWLENAKDWAISRNRYWGTPLPIWMSEKEETVVLGSMEDLRDYLPDRITKVIFIRHGESEGNLHKIRQGRAPGTSLTENGKKQVLEGSRDLKDQKVSVDFIFASRLQRSQESAKILKKELNIGSDIITEDRIREMNFGENEGKNVTDLQGQFERRKSLAPEVCYKERIGITGESHEEITDRMNEFLQEVLEKYPGKTILVVTHSDPLRLLLRKIDNDPLEKFYALPNLPYGTPITYYFDDQTKQKLDLHKHFMDEITITSKETGDELKRVTEVLDCWFESGSMPYAQNHYPFENKKWFEKNFPADFIAEGLDQTRGWFYTLIVLSTCLFDKPAFKNIIVNGIVLAEDGKKMSKRLKNYPEVQLIFDNYGADAMRFYLMNSIAVKAGDIKFGEKGVAEVVKNILLPIWNVYSFFVTYANIDKWSTKEITQTPSDNALDKWIISRLNTLIKDVTGAFDDYDIQKVTSYLPVFIDELSNWYVRRSRRRFWKSENDQDKNHAYQTLYTVLVSLSKIIAPVMPFLAEELYQNLVSGDVCKQENAKNRQKNKESVHLCDWPSYKDFTYYPELENEVFVIKTIVNLGHAARAKARLKVRQPLNKIQVGLPNYIDKKMVTGQIEVLKEELNLKEVDIIEDAGVIAEVVAYPNAKLLGPKYGKDVQEIIQEAKSGNFSRLENGNVMVKEFELLPEEVEIRYVSKEGYGVESAEGIVIALDLNITEELRLEGHARDLVRNIQDMRKEMDYKVTDRIILAVVGIKDVIHAFGDYIKKETLADEITDSIPDQDIEKNVMINGEEVRIRVKRL